MRNFIAKLLKRSAELRANRMIRRSETLRVDALKLLTRVREQAEDWAPELLADDPFSPDNGPGRATLDRRQQRG
jgi:hypothetical protein